MSRWGRARPHHGKLLSDRKDDRVGQMSDVLTDALFRITLDARMHRLSEAKLDNVGAVLSSVKEYRGEVASRATVLTAARGYGKSSFIDVISATGMSCILIMA